MSDLPRPGWHRKAQRHYCSVCMSAKLHRFAYLRVIDGEAVCIYCSTSYGRISALLKQSKTSTIRQDTEL